MGVTYYIAATSSCRAHLGGDRRLDTRASVKVVEHIEEGARTIHGLGEFDLSKWALPPMISSDTHVMEPLDL